MDEPEEKEEPNAALWTELDTLMEQIEERRNQHIEPEEHIVFEGMQYL